MDRFGKISTQDFLNENYHFLSTCTRVDSFLSWLRSRDVLSVCEQEEISSLHSSKSKAARLIDTILYKGDKGFLCYMEVLEWAYPDVFSSITGMQARPPPTEFKGLEQSATSRRSAVLFQELQKCMGNIMVDSLCKKDNINTLNDTVSKLKNENDMMIGEIKQLQSRVQNDTNTIHELNDVNKKLKEENAELRAEKEAKTKKLEEKTNELIQIYLNRKNLVHTSKSLKSPPVSNGGGFISLPVMSKNIPSSKQTEKSQNSVAGTVSLFQNDKRNMSTTQNDVDNSCEDFRADLKKFEEELREKQQELDKALKTKDQLLDLNQRLKSDYCKAVKANEQQHETVGYLRKEIEKLSEQNLKARVNKYEKSPSFGSVSKSHLLPLVRKDAVKKKSLDHSESCT